MMDATSRLIAHLKALPFGIGKVVDFNADTERLYHLNLTAANAELNEQIFADTQKFIHWIDDKILSNGCKFAVGGYMEHRTIYARSALFDTDLEPRRLHLGVDIWGPKGASVYSPLPGKIHSFKDNDNFGDYGPTIIMKHDLCGLDLYSLYGHLSRKSLERLVIGSEIGINEKIGSFGNSNENGQWPPHLHFQLMFDIEGMHGDYPGVCRYSEKEKYLKNIPDPQLILRFPESISVFS
jgi:murein DD-endopeptidase MepM/ murein hydrolase activator NlpD